MPFTTLDASAALVVIDMQKAIVAIPMAQTITDVIGHNAQLARAFRERGLPVVLVKVTGMSPGRTDRGPQKYSFPAEVLEFIPELEQQPGDYVVSKQRVGAFIGTALDVYLRERGVTQVFITGVATGSGVESTARSAFDLGYNVVLVTDAMADRDADVHEVMVRKIFPRMSETDTTANVLKLLLPSGVQL